MTRCTLFFGGAHETCCVQHDQDYSKDSTVSRRDADLKLLKCGVEVARPWRAIIMFAAVRAFGWIFYKGKSK